MTPAATNSETSSADTGGESAAPAGGEPSAALLEVCGHMHEVMRADLDGFSEDFAEFNQQCAMDLETKRAAMTSEQWDTAHACIMAAQTVDSILACGPPFVEDLPPDEAERMLQESGYAPSGA